MQDKDSKENFIFGVAIGGIILMLFYMLLFFPIVFLYQHIDVHYQTLFKYILMILATIALINSAYGAFKSSKIIKNYDEIIKNIEFQNKEIEYKSSFKKGFYYRLSIEFSLF